MPYGSVKNNNNKFEYTIYSSCMDLNNKKYYYKNYFDLEYKIYSLDINSEDIIIENI